MNDTAWYLGQREKEAAIGLKILRSLPARIANPLAMGLPNVAMRMNPYVDDATGIGMSVLPDPSLLSVLKLIYRNRDLVDNIHDIPVAVNPRVLRFYSDTGILNDMLEEAPQAYDPVLAALLKSGAAKPSGYRRRVDMIIHNDKNQVLVGKGSRGDYIFPGGGIDPGEGINFAGIREVKEEAGVVTGIPKAIKGFKPFKSEWNEDIRKKNLAKGRNFRGDVTYTRLAPYDKRDTSLYGDEGDKMKTEFVNIDDVIKNLHATPVAGHPYANHKIQAERALGKVKLLLDIKG